jgi:hypothetical protein
LVAVAAASKRVTRGRWVAEAVVGGGFSEGVMPDAELPGVVPPRALRQFGGMVRVVRMRTRGTARTGPSAADAGSRWVFVAAPRRVTLRAGWERGG